MAHSIDDKKWMHFFAGKESALREVLNNLTNQLSKEIKDNITVRILDAQNKHSNIYNKTNKDCLEMRLENIDSYKQLTKNNKQLSFNF